MHRFASMTLIGVASVVAASAHASAAPVVLLDDRFDAPGATPGDDANDPLDVAYFGFTGSLAVNAGYLRATSSAADARFGSAAFAPATLANVGDRVTFRFDVRGLRTADPTGILGLNLGLYDSGGSSPTDASAASRDAAADDRGVLLHLWDTPGDVYSSLIQRDEAGQTLAGESGAYIGGYRFADGGWHTYEVTLTRTATGLNAELAYDGVARNTSMLASPLTRFDNLQFGTGSSPFEFHLDNLAVTYTAVPEPATLALAAAASATLLRRRRR